VPEALDKVRKTLGEGFAECDTRQKSPDELYIGNDFLVEYFLSGMTECHRDTRQRKVVVTALGDGDGDVAECQCDT
jgi:hypothetical protein